MSAISEGGLAQRVLCALAASLIGLAACQGVDRAGVGTVLPAGTTIPRDAEYKTFSLFIASDRKTIEGGSEALATLERNFGAFGESIGEHHLAVWVGEAGSSGLSISLGKHYVDKFSAMSGQSLEYFGDPYILFSTIHPDDWGVVSRANAETTYVGLAISMDGLTADETNEFLNLLEARIRRERLGQLSLEFDVLALSIRQFVYRNREFAQKVVIALIESR